MPNLTNELADKIALGRAFAFVRMPGVGSCFFDNPVFGPAPEVGPYFRISLWDKGEKGFRAVSRAEYLASLRELIKELSPDMPKVVFSRTIQGRIRSSELAPRITEFFDSFPEALAFVFYHPETGLWFGATPELLLADDGAGRLSTMALAGTRPSGTSGPWDDKNMREHAYVIDYIVEILSSAGATDLSVSSTRTMPYGPVEHLFTPISARIGKTDFSEIVAELSPTPALCGFPRDKARAAIARHESHSRGCYGSHFEFRMPGSDVRMAYVNLRCAHVDSMGLWTAFVGGGIVAGSVPEDEWEETSRKASRLVKILGRE
ncbi:MAG: chorismate-binding protein [Muribaculaceae bacterium]|nr:chorismate-binding protein [Muribaculaceae bacterium]